MVDYIYGKSTIRLASVGLTQAHPNYAECVNPVLRGSYVLIALGTQ